jgi:hypothetical protein
VIEVGETVNCAPEGICKRRRDRPLHLFVFALVLLYIFPEQSNESTSEQLVDHVLRLTRGTSIVGDIIVLQTIFLLSDHFTRANILGELTFDQLVMGESSTIDKLILTHGPDATIDHDEAVQTVS